ncbi:MAG: sulfotransferase family 2 domain-containing protein [Notoacmeibacter sp.]|nr:sulfotransferase family 2 domain-containing protein [Notoacmeibacter sp.]
MIISHAHGYVFLKPRKVGGTSLEIALSRYCGVDDIITPISPEDEQLRRVPGSRSAQNWAKPIFEWSLAEFSRLVSKRERPAKYYNHMPASAVRTAIGSKTWDAYWRFSIVRNPFERIVSAYFWRTRNKPERPPFHQWLLANPRFLSENMDITMENGKQSVNHFIRFEDMPDNLAYVSARTCGNTDIVDAMKTIHAKGGHRKKEATAAMLFEGFAEGIHMVQDICGPELEIGNYPADPFQEDTCRTTAPGDLLP